MSDAAFSLPRLAERRNRRSKTTFPSTIDDGRRLGVLRAIVLPANYRGGHCMSLSNRSFAISGRAALAAAFCGERSRSADDRRPWGRACLAEHNLRT
jgi:hypothetical protein